MRQNVPKSTCPTEHSNRGWPTRARPFRMYHQAEHHVIDNRRNHRTGNYDPADPDRGNVRDPAASTLAVPGEKATALTRQRWGNLSPGITASLAVVGAGPSTGRPSTHTGRWTQAAARTYP